MRKLPTGTRVRVLRDMSPPIKDRAGRPFEVRAGEVGRILAVGPDAAFGWYPVGFDADREILMAVTGRDAAVEVLD